LNASVAMNQKGMSARICRWLYLLGIIRRSAVHRWLVWPGCNTNYSTLLIKHSAGPGYVFFFWSWWQAEPEYVTSSWLKMAHDLWSPSFGCTCSTASSCWDCRINYGAWQCTRKNAADRGSRSFL
jgi:hypothetical protein